MRMISALTLFLIIVVNGYSQQMKLEGKWKLNKEAMFANGDPKFNVDSMVNIKQEGNEITFERFSKSAVVEKTKMDEEVSTVLTNGTTKSVKIVFSEDEECYIMTSKYTNPDKSDFTFIQKWSVDKDGNLVRWMIEPEVYTLVAMYNRVKE